MYLCRDFRGNISMTVHSASDLPYLKIFFIFEAIEKRKKASRSTQKDKFSDRADFSNSGLYTKFRQCPTIRTHLWSCNGQLVVDQIF